MMFDQFHAASFWHKYLLLVGTAWNELQGNLKDRRKGGKQLKFTDLFLGSFRNPTSYKITGKNKDMNDGNPVLKGPKKGDKKIVAGVELTFDGKVWR